MKIKWAISVILLGVIGWGCSTEPDQSQAHISGEFTGIDTVDVKSDSARIHLTIIRQDTAGADTLFHTKLDTSGTFSGTATFPEKQQYPMSISQGDQTIGQMGIILADGDSVRIEGKWANLEETLSISSREHEAMEQYQRLNRNFSRIIQAARSGQLTGDTLGQQLNTWTDLYWQVYENHSGTIASEMSARQSISIAQGLDNELMMDRIRAVQENNQLIDLGTTYGKNYIANSRGLDPALAYLDTLASLAETKDKAIQIDRERIKLLYDSARVDAAQKQLDAFKEKYPDDESSKEWVENMNYDLTYLSPGDSIPDFQFTQNGKTISKDSLLGSPYILEITRLSNQLYQDQFDRTMVIHGIYKNYGLQVVTLPLDDSQITVDAFFDERPKAWPVADAQAFDRQKLIEEFNVQLIPTRFLIDREGKIVRKYVGNEYEDVIQGIQTIIENDNVKEPPS